MTGKESKGRRRRAHPLLWVIEEIEEEPSYLEKSMFGCLGCYLNGRLVLVLAARQEPWSGLLIPTSHEHHASIINEFPDLAAHPVLGKWLWLKMKVDDFEGVANMLIERILQNDRRFGVEPLKKHPPPR